MNTVMKISKREVTLHCSNCGLLWNMPYGAYHSGGFMERKCPQCNFHDTSNSLGGKEPEHRARITVRAISPC